MSLENDIGQPSRILPRTIEDVLHAWSRRALGISLVLAVAVVWVAMLTWSPNDPSLSVNTSEAAQNILGYPGAVVADFFFHTIGLTVVFLAAPVFILGLEWALGEDVADARRRIALIGFSTLAIAAGLSALPVSGAWGLELGYGGIIGDFAYSIVSSLIAVALPEAASTAAGLIFFATGFWVFSRAICLDRYNLLAFEWAGDLDALRSLRLSRRGLAHAAPGLDNERKQHEVRAERGVVMRHAAGRPEPILPEADRYGPAALYDEPDAPSWSMDDPIHAYADPTWTRDQARTAGDDPDRSLNIHYTEAPLPPEGPAADRARVSDLDTHKIATKFAANAGLPADVGADYGHGVMLLDDEALTPPDDLPNVLKRAREEVAEIMPNAPAKRGPHRDVAPPIDAPLPMPAAAAPADHANAPSVRWPPGHLTQPAVAAQGYRRPSYNLLKPVKPKSPSADTSPSVLKGRARILEDVLADFRIKGEIHDVRPGPVITQFELEPARGTKSSRVIALADDVARSMSAVSARIAVVPGRNAIGIELPNTRRETFGLRELIDSQEFLDSSAKLPVVLGKGIGGEPVLADLARMPHMLVAGTTGSGKSVGVNAMILSLIYRLGPSECRFLMIDPKMLELSVYNGIPHLLTPVITDPQKAVTALTWAVSEMEERYKRMAELGVRNIEAFNNRVKHAARTGEKLGRTVQTGFDAATGEAVFEEALFDAEPLPYIVVVVDEFADLMAVAGKEIDGLVQRLAQMARAAGIHLIMATQRPSVDVVTGTIKANFPTRVSYRVASRIDSRTILGEQGAEQLLGQGDMLFLSGGGDIQRVHGPFVSDEEVEAVAGNLRDSYPANDVEDVLAVMQPGPGATGQSPDDPTASDLYSDAVELVLRDQKASTSYLQRRLSIGYNRAADLIDRMEAEGLISAADHAGRRDILLAS